MSYLYWDEDIPNLLRWEPSGAAGEWDWEVYHKHLDEIDAIAQEATEPFYVIFTPSADLPAGSPIQHMKRVVDIAKRHDKLMLMPIVVPHQMPLAATFANVLNRLVGLDAHTPVVRSYEDALAKIRQHQGV